ncbi:MAG: hypothetical protein V8Q46_04420 [Bifidobacterium angulatum]
MKANASASKTPSRSKMGKLLTGSSPEDAERALLSVTHDKVMQDRLRPWMGLIRRIFEVSLWCFSPVICM